MPTLREVLVSRRQRLLQKRAQAITLAQDLQDQIDAINAELTSLTAGEEARFVRLQNLLIIRAED